MIKDKYLVFMYNGENLNRWETFRTKEELDVFFTLVNKEDIVYIAEIIYEKDFRLG